MKGLEKKERDSEILLKQANQQHEEYMRLADKYNELEKKFNLHNDEAKKDK